MKWIIVLFIVPLVIACSFNKANQQKVKPQYVLVTERDGLQVEKFDSTVVDENKYNQNNKVFKVGTNFRYKFEHLTKNGEKKYFRTTNDQKVWEFVPADSDNSTVIKELIIEVANGNPLAKYVPDYNQTCLYYKMGDGMRFSSSGAIENEGNVWMHPPRDYYFKILEINPYPYIKAPYRVGTIWNWQLTIGNNWADERWKTWEGQIKNEYTYEITDKTILKTEFGDIECFVVEGKAKSSIGETSLTSYFNPKYGFVKLDYTNIDGSKTRLELTELFADLKMKDVYSPGKNR
jgi:hypothetical protein